MHNQAGTFARLGPVKSFGQCDPGKTVRSRYICMFQFSVAHDEKGFYYGELNYTTEF